VPKQARNAPCPCGSGRKYKQCCLREEQELARQAQLDDDVGKAISSWTADRYRDELAKALADFHPAGRDIGERDLALFVTWFNSDRKLNDGGTPAEHYAVRADLSPLEREIAERIVTARLGLFRVRAVAVGRSIELENVVTGESLLVASHNVSREVARWDVLLCRVLTGEPPTLWGPVLTYVPAEEQELIAELERLAVDHRLPTGPSGLAEAFRVASRELLRFVPPSRLVEPSLFTAEGDPVEHGRAVWRLADPVAAFVRLDAPPELLWVGESEDGEGETFQLTGDRAELIALRPPLPPGALYYESSYDGLPDRIGLGTFVLSNHELRFDAISAPRLARAVAVIERLLGDGAELVAREITRVDRDHISSAKTSDRNETDPTGAEELLTGYFRRWLDEPLARLDGYTPRAAASEPRLRDELELALRMIENRADKRREGGVWSDVSWLRDELLPGTRLAA
jgi:SEC-C motif